ncbi:MAG TPA: PorV/PorQ family protein [Candidatus Eisenbacteria bacterium]
MKRAHRFRPLVSAVPLVLSLVARGAAADPAGFAFLEVPAGARAAALGGAYASLAQGAEAVFWNPAGLQATSGVEVDATHTELIAGLRAEQFALAGRHFGGGLAASIRAQYSEAIPERDELGNLIGTFGSHDLEFALGYGRALRPGLTVGGSAKYIRERLANAAAGTFAFDAGAGWEPGPAGLKLGAAIQNLGPAAAYTIDGTKGEPVPLPAACQAGVSYAMPLGATLSLSGALEGRFTRGRSGMGLAGAELSAPGAGAALRVGWRANDSASSLSLGAGYAVHAMSFDYAFVPLSENLGDTHRFSLAARF